MKIRRLLLIISMLAVMFSLAGCGETEKEKPFEYNDKDIVLYTMQSFDSFVKVPESNYDLIIESEEGIEAEAIKGIKQAKETDKVGQFEDYSMYYSLNLDPEADLYSIDNEADYVMVTVKNHAENRVVDIQYRYEQNIEYTKEYNNFMAEKEQTIADYTANNEDSFEDYLLANFQVTTYEEAVNVILTSQGLYPFELTEIVISPVYSKSELVGQAGMNTLIGMGTVFVVLIFISFIISLFKYLPALFSSKKTVEPAPAAKPAPAPVVNAVEEEEDLVNDEELVAVIMAAIQAATADQGVCTDSNDTLVVRSIRRAKVRR